MNSIHFCFVGAYGCHRFDVRNLSVLGHIADGNKKDSVGTTGHSSAHPLRQSAVVVGAGGGPDVFVRSLEQMAVLEDAS